ncbi:MAG: hypothetical protein JNK58_13560 [Phycisphaerae bacterium]|nr:hypothetical protein [Phycisphaerae bacterium]
MKDSLQILLTSIVDYAGLFPPAALDLPTTLANWRRYVTCPEKWMLGRLIVPIGKLDEFARLVEREACIPGPGEDAWRLSVLVSDNLDADIDRIFEFNRRFAGESAGPSAAAAASAGSDPFDVPDVVVAGGIVVDAIEVKAQSGKHIDTAMKIIPEQLEPFFEVPVAGGADVRGLIIAMNGTGAAAKIRMGGVTPEAFPAAIDVARFLVACAAADVPFKATAGLHHPMRAEYPLTYEPGCARGVMFGFLNVFAAAAFARIGFIPGTRPAEADLVNVLEESNSRAFIFDDGGFTWRDKRLENARLARVRESFAISFGSCSFEEPLNELKGMGVL